MREVLVVAKDTSITDESITRTVNFIRNLLTTSNWPYNLTYDFRAMKMPTVNFVVRLGAFGNEPDMLKIISQRCSACKVILLPGTKFKMMKAALATFFKIMPPVCRTYLLTEGGELAPDAVVFDPPAKKGSGGAHQAASGASGSQATSAATRVVVQPLSCTSLASANTNGVGPTTNAPPTDLPVGPAQVQRVMIRMLAETVQILCPGGVANVGRFTSL
jgi:hypothetical protein